MGSSIFIRGSMCSRSSFSCRLRSSQCRLCQYLVHTYCISLERTLLLFRIPRGVGASADGFGSRSAMVVADDTAVRGQ